MRRRRSYSIWTTAVNSRATRDPRPTHRPPPCPTLSFRTEQAGVFSSRFAPANRSACAERNLSYSLVLCLQTEMNAINMRRGHAVFEAGGTFSFRREDFDFIFFSSGAPSLRIWFSQGWVFHFLTFSFCASPQPYSSTVIPEVLIPVTRCSSPQLAPLFHSLTAP